MHKILQFFWKIYFGLIPSGRAEERFSLGLSPVGAAGDGCLETKMEEGTAVERITSGRGDGQSFWMTKKKQLLCGLNGTFLERTKLDTRPFDHTRGKIWVGKLKMLSNLRLISTVTFAQAAAAPLLASQKNFLPKCFFVKTSTWKRKRTD